MYKIQPPSEQTYKGPKLTNSPINQIQTSETVTEEILQSQSEPYREQLESMLDFRPNNFYTKSKSNKIELWSTIQSIEKRVQEQENNLHKVNTEQQQEISKLKNELKQQKQQYETEIEELRYSSRLQSQKQQPQSSLFTPKNHREQYSYRSNNNKEESSEKNYLEQLVLDLKQQVQQLQQKNYFTPIQQQQHDNIWEQKYKQLEKQKEAELIIKDQHHVDRICNLESQMTNLKQSYENELLGLRKLIEEKSKDETKIRTQNQQLQKDLNSYINQFNLLQQQAQQQNLQIQQYQHQLQQIGQQLQDSQIQLQQQQQQQQQQPMVASANQKLLEMANQLSTLSALLEKKNQECEYYKQRSQQQIQQQIPQMPQSPQIISYRQALTPTRQNISTSNDSIVFPTLSKQQIQQRFQ